MDQFRVQIDDHTEVRIKDYAESFEGTDLWLSLYVDDKFITGGPGPIVFKLDDEVLTAIAHEWESNLEMRR